MNLHSIITTAANAIENDPTSFDYGCIDQPRSECGTTACALGWIVFYAGQQAFDGLLNARAEKVLGIPYWGQGGFEWRMDEINQRWRDNATLCAETLRRYADKHLSPAKSASLPDWNAIAAKRTVGEHARSQELA